MDYEHTRQLYPFDLLLTPCYDEHLLLTIASKTIHYLNFCVKRVWLLHQREQERKNDFGNRLEDYCCQESCQGRVQEVSIVHDDWWEAKVGVLCCVLLSMLLQCGKEMRTLEGGSEL